MPNRISYAVVSLLAAIAGFVDAVGFITLSRIYVANMSGNSVAVGIQLAFSYWPESLRRLWPILAFVVGMLFCRILVEFGAQLHLRYVTSVALLCEIVFLAPVCLAAWSSPDSQTLYVGLLALAMGIQNAAITNVQSVTIHTGFVTGILLKTVIEFAKYLIWVYDCVVVGTHSAAYVFTRSFKQKSFQLTLWLAFIWCSYVFGACLGTWGQQAFHLRALVFPLLGLLLVIAIDMCHPLGAQDEEAQANLYA